MLIESIILLLRLYSNPRAVKIIQYELAPLQMAGLVDEDNNITPEGRVIVQDILYKINTIL